MYNILHDYLGKSFHNFDVGDGIQCRVDCPKCARLNNDEYDGKHNLELNIKIKKYKCWKCNTSGRLKNLLKWYGSNQLYQFYLDNYEFQLVDDKYIYKSDDEDDDILDITLPKEFISFKNYEEYDNRYVAPYNYLTQTRKLTLNQINKYDLGFCLEGRYKNRIIIPSYNNYMKLNYFMSRSFIESKSSTYLNPVASKEIIINEYLIDWNCRVFIVEGFFDFITIPVNTIILNGKGLSFTLLNKLMIYKPPITMLIDGDAIQDSIKIIETLENNQINNINYVFLENDFDIDDIRTNFGKKSIAEYLTKNTKILTDEDRLWLKK
jgi:hypothetical protein